MSDVQKWLQRAPGVLTFFLVIALGVTFANLLWMVLTPPSAVAQASTLTQTQQVASISRKENYGKLIADQHLFGTVPKNIPKAVKAPPRPKVVKPVVTNLNLKLHGIIASTSNGGGYAMISYNGKAQEVYKRGEAIPKEFDNKPRSLQGVSVKLINDDSVIIDNNGTDQLIELPKIKQVATTSSRTTQASARSRTTNSTSAERMPSSNAKSGKIDTLAALRDAALSNPQVLMSVLTPSIVRRDGAVAGIRVYPSSNRKLFRELGLRNGDIITEVNGIVIDDPSKGMQIFQQISEASSLTIKIKRGGNEQVLNPQF